MNPSLAYTSADLELLPDVEGTRYEIIDGDLYVSEESSVPHQYACTQLICDIGNWIESGGSGVVVCAPGVIFAPDQDVAPDAVWISSERLKDALDEAGHLRIAPELMIEVLSPGAENVRRDRELKLKLYSRQDVAEYWIVDWQQQAIEVYRRDGETLQLVETLGNADTLTTPLLPGFTCPLSRLWMA